MNKTKIFITTMLVAALAAGCSKEDTNGESTRDNVIRIFAGSFQNNGKVTYDPTDVNNVNWVAGERISLNLWEVSDDGRNYRIRQSEENSKEFYLNLGETDNNPFEEGGKICAIYPYADGENDVDVTNKDGNHEIVINNLAIKGFGDESQMAFPMAAIAEYDGSEEYPELLFKHLTAGFRVRLSGVSDQLSDLRIVALSDETSEDNFRFEVDVNDEGDKVMASWGKQGNGPVLPAGPVGGSDQDVLVGNYSEMNFTVHSDAFMEDPVGGYLMDFCIPVTIQNIRTLVIVGYDENGDVLFKKTTNFATPKEIELNRMYTLPVIDLH